MLSQRLHVRMVYDSFLIKNKVSVFERLGGSTLHSYLVQSFPTGQYPGTYPPTSQPTSSYQPPPPPSSFPSSPMTSSIHAGAAAGVGVAAASVSEEEERRRLEERRLQEEAESLRIERHSLESAVEDKIRRHVKQVLDSAKVQWTLMPLTAI